MKRLALIAMLFAVPAAAQQMTPEQSVAAQLGSQVGLLMHENAVLRAQLQQAQAKITALEAAAKKDAPASSPVHP